MYVGGAEGFSEWAATVPDAPMPVRYSVMSNWIIFEHIPGIQFKREDFLHAQTKYIDFANLIAAHHAHVAATDAGNFFVNLLMCKFLNMSIFGYMMIFGEIYRKRDWLL